MAGRIGFTAILVVALATALAAAARPPVERVAFVLRGGASADGPTEGEALADLLTDKHGKVIDLDLTVEPRIFDDGHADYFVSIAGRGEPRALTCDNAKDRLEAAKAFDFSFPDYNHLLMTIRHDARRSRLGGVGCEASRAGAGYSTFHVRGRYKVKVKPIPTANQVILTPAR